jgi:hypothetical protein
MKFMMLAAAAALALAGCTMTPPPGSSADTAKMPLNKEGGPELSQDQAIALSSWALKDPANTAGQPALGARAIAAEDWLAGQWILYHGFDGYAPSGSVAWSTLRAQARAAIGVPPTASSQEVVDRLLAASDDLQAGNVPAAKAQLTAPIFTLGPDRTLAALGSLPPLPGWGWAYAELNRNENRELGNGPPKIIP